MHIIITVGYPPMLYTVNYSQCDILTNVRHKLFAGLGVLMIARTDTYQQRLIRINFLFIADFLS